MTTTLTHPDPKMGPIDFAPEAIKPNTLVAYGHPGITSADRDRPQTMRSVPPIVRREMHRAEPINFAGPLQWQWWARPVMEGSQSLYRALARPGSVAQIQERIHER